MHISRYNPLFSNIFHSRRYFCKKKFPGESTFGLIKPDGMAHLGPIFDIIHEEGFYIRSLRMSQFTKASAKVLYADHTDKDYYPPFADYIVTGPVIGLRLGRLDAINHWRKVIGPTDPEEAKQKAPKSIRALYGTNERVNAVHGADNEKTVYKEIDFFFGNNSLMKRLPTVYPNTILMLTPEIIQTGKLGSIIEEINTTGCKINAMQAFDAVQLRQLGNELGVEDANKIIKKKISTGNCILMEVSHPKGYDTLLEEMLRVENKFDTGFSHFDRGENKLSEK